MKKSSYVLWGCALLLMPSCTSHVRMHSLSTPDPGAVATISEGAFVYVAAVDGQAIKRSQITSHEIEVLPGNHVLDVGYDNPVTNHRSTNNTQVAVQAVGGHKYRIIASERAGHEGTGTLLYTVDDRTNAKVFRAKFTLNEETYERALWATDENDAEARTKEQFPNATNIRIMKGRGLW